MEARDERLHREALALWRTMHGGPAPQDADGASILRLLFNRTEPASYERLTSVHLRRGRLTNS